MKTIVRLACVLVLVVPLLSQQKKLQQSQKTPQKTDSCRIGEEFRTAALRAVYSFVRCCGGNRLDIIADRVDDARSLARTECEELISDALKGNLANTTQYIAGLNEHHIYKGLQDRFLACEPFMENALKHTDEATTTSLRKMSEDVCSRLEISDERR
jgi:hypothetical protein